MADEAFSATSRERLKHGMGSMSFERVMRWALVSIAITGLAAGLAAALAGRPALADLSWTLATLPVIAGLAVSIVRDLLAGRLGVDAIALVSMSAAVFGRKRARGDCGGPRRA
jgi:hypothetical protein